MLPPGMYTPEANAKRNKSKEARKDKKRKEHKSFFIRVTSFFIIYVSLVLLYHIAE